MQGRPWTRLGCGRSPLKGSFGQNGREELPAIERRKALKTQVPRHRPCSFNSQCVAKSGINVAHVTIPANDTFKLVIKNRSEIIGHDH